MVRAIATAAALFAATACTPLQLTAPQSIPTQPITGSLTRLLSDLTQAIPGTERLTPALNPNPCGPADIAVVRSTFPENVLFATNSDQPAPDAAGILTQLAARIHQDAPNAVLTVLGHTDSVGSDAYNLDLSDRRAFSVLRALVAAGLDPDRLGAVAIGKRQPIADNATPEGRARNRRVEFLISHCLAANLAVIQTRPSTRDPAPVNVMRLDPSVGLSTVGSISLKQPTESRPIPAALAPPHHSPLLPPPAAIARPTPAPHYQPNPLSPDAQPSPLGPAVPF